MCIFYYTSKSNKHNIGLAINENVKKKKIFFGSLVYLMAKFADFVRSVSGKNPIPDSKNQVFKIPDRPESRFEKESIHYMV